MTRDADFNDYADVEDVRSTFFEALHSIEKGDTSGVPHVITVLAERLGAAATVALKAQPLGQLTVEIKRLAEHAMMTYWALKRGTNRHEVRPVVSITPKKKSKNSGGSA